MRPHAKSFKGVENMTHQSFKDECDVNRIVKQFTKTGIVNHLARGTPQYGEAVAMDLHTAACISAEVASKTEEGAFSPETGPDPSPEEKALQEPSEAPKDPADPPPETSDKEVDGQSIPL